MKMVVDVILIGLLLDDLLYDDLVGCYEFTDAEINAAGRYISHTAPDDILEMLEELAFTEEEKGEWAW